MGRRKIEIKTIKDDRNRSVTFLKRKGGLFKKAHELSVLCSVDVAVIIFGNNKKLYEFSSRDIHSILERYHYSQPHEHKGPADFNDKDGGDDDEDEDMAMGTPPQEMPSPPHHGIAHHPSLHEQPHMQHMRQRSTPSMSASPPMQNGAFPPHRLSTPQPPHPGSRPTSRNHIRRQSSNLVPQHHPHPQAAQPMQQHPQYSYHPQAQYGPQQGTYMRPTQGTPPISTPPMPQHHYSHPGPPQTQMQQLYLEEQRRRSMPPQIPMHSQSEVVQQMPVMHTPPQPSRPFQSPPLPGHEPQRLPQHRMSDQGAGLGLMQQGYQSQPLQQREWQPAPPADMPSAPIKEEDMAPRPQSVDIAAANRHDDTQSHFGVAPATAPITQSSHQPSMSMSSMPAPSRVNSMQSNKPRGPKLSVQIPGGVNDDAVEDGAAEESSEQASEKTSSTPAKPGTSETSHHSNLVLPAPSPRSASAGAILSAGATGPVNPFARPNIPKKTESTADQFKDASPMSALPSRVMHEHGYMSSPSSMFPELGFGSLHGNALASPAVYQPTPITYSGPSFRDEPLDKRKISPGEDEQGPSKKPRSD